MLLLKRVATGVALVVTLGGCASRMPFTREAVLGAPANLTLTVYTRDKKSYQLQTYTLADSVLWGRGTVKEHLSYVPFDGGIPLDQVVAISTSSPHALRNLAMFGIAAVFLTYAIQGTGSHSGVSEEDGVVYHSPPLGGTVTSCPSLYVWDGRRYVLEAEPFAVSWGRAFEMTTAHLLPAARPDHGVMRLRVADERQEVHYLNAVRLRAVDLGDARAAALDTEGRAWALTTSVSPVEARDAAGRAVISDLAAADGRMWECDPSILTPGSGYADVVELTFARPAGEREGLLTVTAVNTDLSTAVYGQLCRLVGDQAPLLAHAVETDAELIAHLRDYFADASLEVRVWNGRDWSLAGSLHPEGSAAAFTRALRLRIPEGAGDRVRVRLRSMADVWRLDRVAAQWGAPHALPSVPLAMLSATGPGKQDVKASLEGDDDRRLVMLPPDQADLAFAAPPARRGARWTFVAECRGYLTEWVPPVAGASGTLPEPRIESLKRLLENRDLALAAAYEDWRRMRQK